MRNVFRKYNLIKKNLMQEEEVAFLEQSTFH